MTILASLLPSSGRLAGEVAVMLTRHGKTQRIGVNGLGKFIMDR
jgi:hypothetical protein